MRPLRRVTVQGDVTRPKQRAAKPHISTSDSSLARRLWFWACNCRTSSTRRFGWRLGLAMPAATLGRAGDSQARVEVLVPCISAKDRRAPKTFLQRAKLSASCWIRTRLEAR
jgi:hypothetical protein